MGRPRRPRRAPKGVYFAQLVVNGRALDAKKIVVE
jgi:hypothetical protein